MRLYGWHSSSTSFRVRIALALKGCSYEHVPVNLRWEHSDHDRSEYRTFNPQTNIPVLVDDRAKIAQSLAIIEYLEETRPEPPLLPKLSSQRARVRSLALFIACEIQPPNNLRVQRRLAAQFHATAEALSSWQLHWCEVGFDSLESQLAGNSDTGRFCQGDTPTVADCFLVPQVYSSLRPVIGADLAKWPTIRRIYDACLAMPEFERSLPQNQPGFESPVGH
jgi:maleylacetoacetate isomerase